MFRVLCVEREVFERFADSMYKECEIVFFRQKTAYEMRISDWSSDVCSSDLRLQVDGTKGGHLQTLEWPTLVQDKQASAQPFAFRYFQQLEEIGRASCRERVCQYV